MMTIGSHVRALLGAAILAVGGGEAAHAQSAADEAKDNWIFVFKDKVAQSEVAAKAASAALVANATPKFVYTHAIKGFSAKMPAAAAKALAASNPNIAYYEADQVGSVASPMLLQSGGGSQPPQQVPWGIVRVNGRVDGTGKTAWVIDTGIQMDHPDLNVDVARSVNLGPAPPNEPDDEHGHGTHVAGIIGALDNDIGVVGVAPNASLVAVRVLNKNGNGPNSKIIAGVDHVAAHGAPGDVANFSIAIGPSTALDNAVKNAAAKGIKFAIGAANAADFAGNYSPARVNGPNIYTVSAFDENDTFASFSNYGNPPIDCSDPGVGILSTYLGSTYAEGSGTSMAAPHLAGVLLLGAIANGGYVNGDPDGTPDMICVH